MSSPTGPYKLVTVNTAPDRAKRLIGRVVEDVKDKYTIIHAGNAACKFSFLPISCQLFLSGSLTDINTKQ